MNVKRVETEEQFTVDLVIEIEQDQFEAALEQVYRKQRGSISVPGFRKGKAPRKVIEAQYGSGVFYQDAIEDLYPDACEEAIQAENLDIVAAPKVEIMDMGSKGFTFRATITTRPIVTLTNYMGLTADKIIPSVAEDAVEKELNVFVDRAAHIELVTRAAQNGDTVSIDYAGFNDGVAFDGGTADHYDLVLGSNSFIPGFEAQVVGMSAGDEKEVNVSFPEDYHAEELAGKPVVFKVKLNEVKAKVLPEIDDEFAKDVSEFETLEAFKLDLRAKVADRALAQSEMQFKQLLIDQLSKQVTIDIPKPMLEAQLDRIMQDYNSRLEAQGISMDMYLNYMNMTTDAMRDELRESAERQLRIQLALDAVALAENIVIPDSDVDAEYAKIADNMKITPEEVEQIVPRADFKRDMARDHALAVVAANAKPNLIEQPTEVNLTEVTAE